MLGFLDVIIEASHHQPVIAGLAIIGLETLSFLLVFTSTFHFHIACGFLFGLPGMALAPVSNTLGATAGYLSSRACTGCFSKHAARLSKHRARCAWCFDERKVQRMRNLQESIDRQPFLFVGSLKLSPVTPGGLTAFVLGQWCKIPVRVYVPAVLLGGLPSVCAEVYVGTLLSELSELAEGKPVNPVSTVVFVVCMVLSIAGCVLASRRSKRLLADTERSVSVGDTRGAVLVRTASENAVGDERRVAEGRARLWRDNRSDSDRGVETAEVPVENAGLPDAQENAGAQLRTLRI